MNFDKLEVPSEGSDIKIYDDGRLNAGNYPMIPLIEGDRTGADMTPAMKQEVDSAVEKAYGGQKKINRFEVYAGDKALEKYGNDDWLAEDTLKAFDEYL